MNHPDKRAESDELGQQKNVTDLFIRHFGFWPQLSDRERDLLNAHTHAVHYERGTQVHRGPFDCIGVLLIKKGQLRVYTLSEDGRDVTLYRLFADDIGILSAACTLDAVTFDVYIDAEEDTDVLLTDALAFRRLSMANIYVRCFAYELASKRLSDMLWKMQQVLFLSADRRFATKDARGEREAEERGRAPDARADGPLYGNGPRGRHPPDQVLQSGGLDHVGPRLSAHRGPRGT